MSWAHLSCRLKALQTTCVARPKDPCSYSTPHSRVSRREAKLFLHANERSRKMARKIGWKKKMAKCATSCNISHNFQRQLDRESKKKFCSTAAWQQFFILMRTQILPPNERQRGLGAGSFTFLPVSRLFSATSLVLGCTLSNQLSLWLFRSSTPICNWRAPSWSVRWRRR